MTSESLERWSVMDSILHLFPPHIWHTYPLDVCLGVLSTVLKGQEARAKSVVLLTRVALLTCKVRLCFIWQIGKMPRTWCWQQGFRLPAVQAVGHAGAPVAPTHHQPEVMFPLSSVMLCKTEFKTGRIKANFRIFISSLKWVICRKCKLWRLSSRFSCCGLLWLLQSILSYFKKKKKKKTISAEILASLSKTSPSNAYNLWGKLKVSDIT